MKRVAAAILILGAFATLLGLGTWQLQRLEWKQGLIAEAETRPTLPPVSLDDVLALPQNEWAYRRVMLTGRFVGEPVRVFTTLSDPNGAYEGPGYWLMHPFQAAGSPDIVFVNRGFIPFVIPPGETVRRAPVGTVQFEGLVRPDDPAGWMTPDPDMDQRIIYRRDTEQLRLAAGLDAVLPMTVDRPAHALPGLPQAGETKFAFTNRHLEYALTWYGLALVLLGVVGAALWRRQR